MRLSAQEALPLRPVELAAECLFRLLGDFSREELRALAAEGYRGKFETEDLTPLVDVGGAHVLELFRGPTCAFKDVALSLLPRLIVSAREKLGVSDDILILTATSGDTGKAALEGFRDVKGTRIIVFYPQDGVSDVQKAQMVFQAGDNVRVCAVRGNFDDAQSGVKEIFAHELAHGWASSRGVRLSSANSINLGRLAPQVFYYYKAYADLVLRGKIRLGERVNFAVPTGNFGDILAGEFARRMGLPVARLICASNANSVLTDFIRTGAYDRVRPFYKTTSPSMDILISSNLERYLFLAGDGDADSVAAMMRSLQETGRFTAPESLMKNMREVFWADSADDSRVAEVIGRVYRDAGYLMDTHTAAAWSAMERFRETEDNGLATVVLATASPYKFPQAVLAALSLPAAETGFGAMEALERATGVPVPAPLAALREQSVRHRDSVARAEMLDYVKKAVEA
jgi:threonine synthase